MTNRLVSSPPPEDWGTTIDDRAISQVVGALRTHQFDHPTFDYAGVPSLATPEEWARFVILGVSVVWRLWPPEGHDMWAAELDGAWLDDASGIWACFARRPESLDLEWHTEDPDDRSGFFAGRGVLQDVPRRLDLLGHVAQAIQDRWSGSAMNLVEAGAGGATAIAELLIETIPGYRDRPETELGVLPFDKLAHLAVAMMSARLPITGVEDFPVYPDYMLPRHLRHLGILVYQPELAAAIDARHLIAKDSPWELGIRWATIHGAALLQTAVAEAGNPVTTPQLDYWLWSEAVLGPEAGAMGEHHRTVTEAY